MKLAVRAFALTVVLAGAAAASLSSSNAKHPVAPNRQATASALPVPVCFPGLPTCESGGKGK